MPMVEETWETLANKPGGDRDREYPWGNPRGGLTLIQQSRLQRMRGLLLDVSHAPASIREQLRYGGDQDYASPTNSGLWIPDPRWSDDA